MVLRGGWPRGSTYGIANPEPKYELNLTLRCKGAIVGSLTHEAVENAGCTNFILSNRPERQGHCHSFNYCRSMYSFTSASDTSRMVTVRAVEAAVSVGYSSGDYCGSLASASLEGREKLKEGGTGGGHEMFEGLIDTKRTM